MGTEGFLRPILLDVMDQTALHNQAGNDYCSSFAIPFTTGKHTD